VGAAFIARRRGLLSESAYQAIASAVDHIGPRPAISDLRAPRVLEALSRDKKSKAGRVPFILPSSVGQVEIHDDVSRAEIVRALREMALREKQRAEGDDSNGTTALRS
jgi:3-dehydroquinate synthase